MPRLAYLAAICLAGAALSAPNAMASAPDPVAIAAQMFPASPCNGKITVAFNPGLDPSRDAEAAINDLSRYSLDCVVTFRTAAYNAMTVQQRCATFVHEAGHLAGFPHGPGIMGAHAAQEYFAPCATLRDRIRHRLLSRPDAFSVSCGKQQGATMICRVELVGLRGRAPRRYSVRVSGDRFSLRQV